MSAIVRPTPASGSPSKGHQRNKSSVLRSFMMHRHTSSDAEELAAAALLPPPGNTGIAGPRAGPGPLGELSHNLQQESTVSQTEKHGMVVGNARTESDPLPEKKESKKLARNTPSPAKRNNSANHGSLDNDGAPVESGSPTKKMRPRSTANFVGLLSRSKSLRNLHKGAKEAETEVAERDGERGHKKKEKNRLTKDKENQTPPSTVSNTVQPPPMVTPIYAQFCSASRGNPSPSVGPVAATQAAAASKPRPKSFHPMSSNTGGPTSPTKLDTAWGASGSQKKNTNTGTGMPTTPAHAVDPAIDPQEIDTHLEALLNRRNIPEHQRYKMRHLADVIKMELIRQDWAEERAKRRPGSHDSARSAEGMVDFGGPTHTGATTTTASSSSGSASGAASGRDQPGKAASKSKHSRVKSLTLSRVTLGRSGDRGNSGSNSNSTGRHKAPGSPLKKKAEGTTLGRHLRSKSIESFVSTNGGAAGDASDTTSSTGGGTASGNNNSAIAGFFAKAKAPHQHTPGDFVKYLRTVQQPELVEVGKLHKLRLLLRNETVAWTEDFIGQGGMEETVGLLHRILAIEWREEHEDALLHENLLCLKALCTTELALQYLHSIHASLLPALIHMIFDPEKKGPSEFTTRNIVTSVLFTYIQSASLQERPERAKTVLDYLRDPEGSEDERPVSFVLEMRRDRPYRVWSKEVVSVTKEVFWIFLHHLNIVSLPAAAAAKSKKPSPQPDAATGCIPGSDPVAASAGDAADPSASHYAPATPSIPSHPSPPPHGGSSPAQSYMLRHFPQERPPVPAAPYVGGVEWEATNYLASHLDLVNAILACTPTAAERNRLRRLMQVSGWERCMGGSLRLCKEKFYGAVHDGLRTWVAAAYEDGWDVRDVRYGPAPIPTTPSTERSSPKKKVQAVGGPLADEPAPKIEIPKLDFVLEGEGI